MNTYYAYNDRIYKIEKEVLKAVENETYKKYDYIDTDMTFEEFENRYYKFKMDGWGHDDALYYSIYGFERGLYDRLDN